MLEVKPSTCDNFDEDEDIPWYADSLISNQVFLPVTVTSKEWSGAMEELSQLGQTFDFEKLGTFLYHLKPASL